MNIRQTLAARAKETGCSYKQLLTHYAVERFLYRLSCSPHAGSFFLKGGMLLMGMGTAPARTTMDIDLLGRVDNSPENIARVFRSILHAKTHGSDNVTFDAGSMRTSEIMKDVLYVGVRVTITRMLQVNPVRCRWLSDSAMRYTQSLWSCNTRRRYPVSPRPNCSVTRGNPWWRKNGRPWWNWGASIPA